jgi:hypothetical protein
MTDPVDIDKIPSNLTLDACLTRLSENDEEIIGLRNEIAKLRKALENLLKFSEELCDDIHITTHSPSMDDARRLLTDPRSK